MPISGLVIRLREASQAASVREELKLVTCLELGQVQDNAVSAVIDALDYQSHDAALSGVQEIEGVCTVDVVFHDFSDLTEIAPMA